ncbi:MAG: hypothetical protein Q8L14_21850 [Myxococcales bacterium]|nr:hypothetical protein [Myxococcales bacterium]
MNTTTNEGNMHRTGAALLAVVFFGWACGGGVPFKEGGKAASELKGRVIKGPVTSATVVAYRASDTLDRGEVLAQAKTDEAGDFVLPLPPYQGHVLVVATAGSYIEEAIGLGVQLGDNELQLLLPDFTTGTKLEGLRLTPVSTLAVAFARFHVARGSTPADAHREALMHLHQHFGGVDWSTVTPADLSVAGVTNLAPESRAGLVLAGLSWLAKQQAEASDVTPGLVVNAATLTTALARDAADGTFDGRAGTEQLKQAKVSLSGVTLRADLVQAMTGFINSPRNASALRLQDITTFLAVIGTDNDPYLFCPGQVAAASCGTGPIDTEPPTLAFIKPNAGAGVAGSTEVEVHASDNVAIASLKFTSPASLATAVPVLSNSNRDGVLTATLDVSALPDGPVEIRAEVTDASGNPAAKSVTITVSNQGPRINFTAPGAGATVRGSAVAVSASAMAQAPGATISRIELVAAPPGMGVDTLPAADAFAVTWDTTAAPEGTVALTLRATDSFGTSTETSVSVVVDNVALGQVSAVVSAGAPVDGLTVKLLAIDATTGLPVTGRAGGPILGQSSGVTVDGGVSFALTQENYVGPVQLVAEGASVTYVDPSDGTTSITLPANFSFSSYVESYHTGDRLDRPLTFMTTLADAAAKAYALGRNPAQATPVLLPAALRAVDPLFSSHITSSPWNFRTVYPVSLTTTSQSLRDGVYAAVGDVAFNQEARDIATDVGLTAGTGFAAPQFLAMLLQDIADGQFDGRANGVQLQTAGTTPYLLDTNTTRFRQAIALDKFVRGTQNRTQLTRQDLQTSNIYDTMSMDTSILYGVSPAAIPFDNAGPVATWTVTYQKDVGVTAAPVGLMHLVHGMVQLSIDATDVSGVASLTAVVNAQPIAAGSGSTASHFVGTFDVNAATDGPLTVTATACDRLANCATSTYLVTVDNTKPTISLLQPAAGVFVSRSFDAEATSTDANGLDTFAATVPSGLVDQDTQVGRVFVAATSWTLSAPEGASTITYVSCDVVGNCQSVGTPFVVDRTPPTVAITSSVPAYTNQTTVTLSGTVSDGTGAGVARVLAQGPLTSTLTPVAATVTGGTWTVVVPLTPSVSNVIKVWAEDRATPLNGGPTAGAPYVATATVGTDSTPPNVLPAVGVTSYRDERNLNVAKDAQGRPVMPVSYVYAGGPVVVGENSSVFKIRSKSGAADDNVPFIRWEVQQDTGSPIVSGTYGINIVNGVFCNGACGSGALRVSTATKAGYVLYELPIHLGTLSTEGTVGIGVTFTDAAGNATTRGFSVNYFLVGAPVVAVLDSNFASYGDTASIYPYSTTTNYPALIGTTKRVLRWVIYNPNQEVVWTALAHTGFSGSWSETWFESAGYATGGGMSDLGQNWNEYNDWYSKQFNVNWPPTSSECTNPPTAGAFGMGPFPCGQSTASFGIWFDPKPFHYLGDSAAFTRCEAPHTGTTTASIGNTAYPNTNALGVSAGLNVMANPLPTGKEPGGAPAVTFNGNSGWSIPAATSSTASAIAVYVTVATPSRPGGVPAATFPLSGTGQQRFRAGWTYDWTNNDSQVACVVCRGFACLTYSATYYNQGWTARYFDRYLNSHTVGLSGALTLKTNPNAVTSGTAFSAWSNIPYSYSATR